jgi:hypothetical protein
MLRHKTSFLPGSLAFILAAERSFVNLIATFVKVNVYSVRLLILHSRKWILEMQSQKFARKFDKLYEMSDEEARKQKFPGGVSLYYFKEMGKRTAADYLLENRKPVLIMQGGKDFQALRDVDFVQFQEVLKGKNNVEYREYPQLNHAFVEAIYDDILKASGEYRVERHIGDEVLDDIAEFILR